MFKDMESRLTTCGELIASKGYTVRKTATETGLSKSIVHRDMRLKLPEINPQLAENVFAVMQKNKSEAPRRGGKALQRKRRSVS